MKKYIIIIGVLLTLAAVVIGLIWWYSPGNSGSDGFTVQKQVLQGKVDDKYASARELQYLFKMTIPTDPATTDQTAQPQTPYTFVNEGKCTCVEWDTELNLAKLNNPVNCATGAPVTPGLTIEVACTTPNTPFYLHR